MSSSNSKNFITLRCSDNEFFELEEVVAHQSQNIKHTIEDGCSNNIISMPHIHSKVFVKVGEYCKKHATNDNNDDLKKWDVEFVDVDIQILINLINSANYLSIRGLLDLTCKVVADIMRGHTPEEIRGIFNIKNDYTPDEEEVVRGENQWAFDD